MAARRHHGAAGRPSNRQRGLGLIGFGGQVNYVGSTSLSLASDEDQKALGSVGSVLDRLARSDEAERGARRERPRFHSAAGKLPSVVQHDRLRQADCGAEPIEDARDPRQPSGLRDRSLSDDLARSSLPMHRDDIVDRTRNRVRTRPWPSVSNREIPGRGIKRLRLSSVCLFEQPPGGRAATLAHGA